MHELIWKQGVSTVIVHVQVFADNAGVTAALAKFQADLSAAEATIIARNAVRKVKYEVMLPSLVLNSVSI